MMNIQAWMFVAILALVSASVPPSREFAAVTYANGGIYISGGIRNGCLYNDLWFLNLSQPFPIGNPTWKNLTTADNNPFSYQATLIASIDGSSLLLFGSSDDVCNRKYSIIEGSWTNSALSSCHRFVGQAAIDPSTGLAYVFGGQFSAGNDDAANDSTLTSVPSTTSTLSRSITSASSPSATITYSTTNTSTPTDSPNTNNSSSEQPSSTDQPEPPKKSPETRRDEPAPSTNTCNTNRMDKTNNLSNSLSIIKPKFPITMQKKEVQKDGPPSLRGHTLTWFNGRIILLGGIHSDNATVESLYHAWIFTPEKEIWYWQPLSNPPEYPNRWAHTTVATSDGKLIVVGGRNSSSNEGPFALAILNLLAWEWESYDISPTDSLQPKPMSGHSAVLINGKMFITSTSDDYLNLYIFDTYRMAWVGSWLPEMFKNNGDVQLSKGGLAGLILALLIFGVLITIICVFIIRRREQLAKPVENGSIPPSTERTEFEQLLEKMRRENQQYVQEITSLREEVDTYSKKWRELDIQHTKYLVEKNDQVDDNNPRNPARLAEGFNNLQRTIQQFVSMVTMSSMNSELAGRTLKEVGINPNATTMKSIMTRILVRRVFEMLWNELQRTSRFQIVNSLVTETPDSEPVLQLRKQSFTTLSQLDLHQDGDLIPHAKGISDYLASYLAPGNPVNREILSKLEKPAMNVVCSVFSLICLIHSYNPPANLIYPERQMFRDDGTIDIQNCVTLVEQDSYLEAGIPAELSAKDCEIVFCQFPAIIMYHTTPPRILRKAVVFLRAKHNIRYH